VALLKRRILPPKSHILSQAPILFLKTALFFSMARFVGALSRFVGYGVGTISRLLKIIGIFCRILSLL